MYFGPTNTVDVRVKDKLKDFAKTSLKEDTATQLQHACVLCVLFAQKGRCEGQRVSLLAFMALSLLCHVHVTTESTTTTRASWPTC